MFQDEARFGRITQPSRCWAPLTVRPLAPKQVIRQYTYVYGAFCPMDGQTDSFILPDMYADTMSVFLDEVSKRHPAEYLLMVMDGAPCHRSGTLRIPHNIQLLRLPPYSPELNPAENMWDEIREKGFRNCVFRDMKAVEERLIHSLQGIESDTDRVKSITGWKWIVNSISNAI